MKKQVFPILLILTCIFAAFTAGLFVGKNAVRGDIQISKFRPSPIHADKASEIHFPPAEDPTESVAFPLNINSATAEQLTALPGIGESLARRILDCRDACGGFSAPEELLNVPGIGPGKLEAILDLITTGG